MSMCDEQTFAELEAFQKKQGISRRKFAAAAGATAATTAVALTLRSVAAGTATVSLVGEHILVPTPDGEADCFWVRPAKGEHPAVIMWPDIHGMRPAFFEMASRLAGSGYAVLAVNPYYRTVKGRFIPEGKNIHSPGIRELVAPHREKLSKRTCIADGRAFVDWLRLQEGVATDSGMGTLGYCMTGSYALWLAGAMPEHIRAAASFHGGRLVVEGDSSPHLAARTMRGGALIAIAQNDHERDPGVLDTLHQAFDAAAVEAEIEVYEGAMHGWCVPDNPAYNTPRAERAWGRLISLFNDYLR
jgi:carboxymethylenebutenolidase